MTEISLDYFWMIVIRTPLYSGKFFWVRGGLDEVTYTACHLDAIFAVLDMHSDFSLFFV